MTEATGGNEGCLRPKVSSISNDPLFGRKRIVESAKKLNPRRPYNIFYVILIA
jgi:hypothetical protein